MKYTFTFIFILLLSVLGSAQSIDKITRRCPVAGNIYASVSVANDITYTPCPNQLSFFSGPVKMLDRNYIPLLGATSYFTMGWTARQTLAPSSHFIPLELKFPITISGSNGNYYGQHTSIDVQGTVTNPTIFGSRIDLFSNSLFTSGTGISVGQWVDNDVGAPLLEAYGGRFSAQSGGAGASGLGTIIGVQGAVGMAHNANTTNAFAGDFWLASSASTPSAVTLASAVRARASVQPGLTVADLRGIAVTNWANLGGITTKSYAVYIDQSVDTLSANSRAIYSLSQSSSMLRGDLYLIGAETPPFGVSRGIVLQSPDGTCYRYTAANGGALSAGVSVPCAF